MALPRTKRSELSLEEELRQKELAKEKDSINIQNKGGDVIGVGAEGSGNIVGKNLNTQPSRIRNVNVWIENHDSHLPLIVKEKYGLMINVGETKLNTILSVNAERLEKYSGNDLLVAVVSDDFTVTPAVQTLTLPISGDSKPVLFEVTPRSSGIRNISALFYYKVNLLQMVSIAIEVLSESDTQSSKRKSEAITPRIVLTADRGFESIREIESQI
jgi:hypothetical protein